MHIEINENGYLAVTSKLNSSFLLLLFLICLFLCFSSPTSSTSHHFLSIQRLRKDERDLDDDEDKWFNDEIDESKFSSFQSRTLFTTNNSDDDEDSQSDMTNAMSSNEPKLDRSSSDDDDDDNDLSTSTRSFTKKSTINIQIGSSSLQASDSSTYTMVKSPALSNIADQYNDDDDDDDDDNNEEDEEQEQEQEEGDDEENSETYSNTNKRKLDHDDNDDEQTKVFKKTSEQLES